MRRHLPFWLLALGALALLAGRQAAPVGAEALCLSVERGNGAAATMAVALGDEVRLSFSHSIYGSSVEEHFRVTQEGLQLVRLRYAEQRLAEFYGHEAARREGDWWVVEGESRVPSPLTLRASAESSITITVGPKKIPLWKPVEPGGGVRLSVVACDGSDHAR